MREIKYRAFGSWGKRKGEWWYGTNKIEKYFGTDKRKNHLSLHAFERLIKGEILNPLTRGQYTGFIIKDKEIYEGDIIKGRKDTVYKVVFERGCFFLYHVNLFNPDKTNLRWGLLSRLFDSDMIDIEKNCEIIGNIYENQKLVNEVK